MKVEIFFSSLLLSYLFKNLAELCIFVCVSVCKCAACTIILRGHIQIINNNDNNNNNNNNKKTKHYFFLIKKTPYTFTTVYFMYIMRFFASKNVPNHSLNTFNILNRRFVFDSFWLLKIIRLLIDSISIRFALSLSLLWSYNRTNVKWSAWILTLKFWNLELNMNGIITGDS